MVIFLIVDVVSTNDPLIIVLDVLDGYNVIVDNVIDVLNGYRTVCILPVVLNHEYNHLKSPKENKNFYEYIELQKLCRRFSRPTPEKFAKCFETSEIIGGGSETKQNSG